MAFHGMIGRKLGMTQIFAEDGTAVPVTARARRTRSPKSARTRWMATRRSSLPTASAKRKT